MRYFESILKLAFIVISIYFISTKNTDSTIFIVYLVLCLALGITLIFNKKSSYNYPHSARDYRLRKLEGFGLVAFSFVTAWVVWFASNSVM